MDSEANQAVSGQSKLPGTFRDYFAIARLDHATKQVFIVPGFIMAYLLRGPHVTHLIGNISLGLIAAVSIASANYAINEFLDREFDKYHPKKSRRRAVQTELSRNIVLLEWTTLITIGLASAFLANATMGVVACLFGLQGVAYNVPPLRTKDKAYVDVISESINNPLRLMIGWAMVDATTLPPSSLLLAYWLGGAFLMAAKRYSEYREIVISHGKDVLTRYRASFSGYSDVSLNVSCFVYGLLSSFFLAVFLIKYRIEYLLLMPPVIALFAYYLALSTETGSSAQNPETLFRERALIALVVFIGVLFVVTTFVDLPVLSLFSGQQYIRLD